ncbi:MAG: endonuclease III [Chthoniobacterales bacterium]|nr:endonuclease III [Chthoniobacterales bacterium]
MKPHQHAILLAKKFTELYPNAHCELHYQNPLELLVATILSAQCTDVRVNQVTPALFQRCKKAEDYALIPQEELETIIHSTGFFRNKATAIRKTAAALLERHAGKIPQSLAELSALPGVGRKTANVVLSNVFEINEGVVVDTHVGRLSQRLGLTRHHQPVKIEQDLMKLFPQKDWGILSHWLILHGRRRCYARKPDCMQCELRLICPSVDQPDKFLKKN